MTATISDSAADDPEAGIVSEKRQAADIHAEQAGDDRHRQQHGSHHRKQVEQAVCLRRQLGHQFVLQQTGPRLRLLAVMMQRVGMVRQPRHHVAQRSGKIVAVRVVEVAKEGGQARHLSVNNHQLAADIDERLPLIVPGVANDSVLDPVELVADVRPVRQLIPCKDCVITASMSSAGERKGRERLSIIRRIASTERSGCLRAPISMLSSKAKRKWPRPPASRE